MTRAELILRTRQLVEEGDRLQQQPSLGSLRTWLQISDGLLSAAWGSMDRYHLAWLTVGKPKDIVRGRELTPAEEADYVRNVAGQKTAALRMSLDAAEQGMPFVGEEGGVGPGFGSATSTELELARREALAHQEHAPVDDRPRAPRPERMQR